jgi:hypothetical protein
MADDDTRVLVRVVMVGATLMGWIGKPTNIATLDALNLKNDFFALTDAWLEGDKSARRGFIAINKSRVISVEELPPAQMSTNTAV